MLPPFTTTVHEREKGVLMHARKVLAHIVRIEKALAADPKLRAKALGLPR